MSHVVIEGRAPGPCAAAADEDATVIGDRPAIPGPCRLAMALVAAAEELEVGVLAGRQRSTAPVATARQLAMYIAHVGLGLPQAGVAQAFRRDRSTVAHACRRIEDLRDDPAFDHRVARLEASLRWAAER